MAADSVRGALEVDVARMAPAVRDGALAALALRMAEAFDTRPSAIMAKELAVVLDRLAELSPAEVAKDSMDDLEAKRASRRHSA